MTHSPSSGPLCRPSSAYRWSRCPGSATIAAQLKAAGETDSSSPYAIEGLAAHALGAHAITTGLTDLDKLVCKRILYAVPRGVWEDPERPPAETKAIGDTLISQEMAEAVRAYTQWAFAALDAVYPGAGPSDPDVCLVEVRRTLESLGGQGGTADLVIADWPERLTICDYKHGVGVAVSPVDNLQLLYYAALVADDYLDTPFDEVRLCVIQPRCTWAGEPVREWVIPWSEFSERVTDLKRSIQRCIDSPEALIPGPYCSSPFACPGLTSGTCPAIRGALDTVAEQTAGIEKITPAAIDLGAFTAEQITYLLDRADLIRKFLGVVEDHAKTVILTGGAVEGYKVVHSIGNRAWTDKGAVEALLARRGLKKVAYEAKLLGPAALGKALKSAGKDPAIIDEYIHRPVTGTVLVPASDKRPSAVEQSATADFAESDD